MNHILKLVIALTCLIATGCSSSPLRGAGNWAGHTEVGNASFYADRHQGLKTASGERYDASRKTAAHRKLPFGSELRVTNVSNGKSVIVTVNDRGPSARNRVVDLSNAAFSRISDLSAGVIRVRIEVID